MAARAAARQVGTATTSQAQNTAMKPSEFVVPAIASVRMSMLQAATESAVRPRRPSDTTQPLMLRAELR